MQHFTRAFPLINFLRQTSMNKTLLAVGLVRAQMLAVNAFAQSTGEADPSGAMATPGAKATPAEEAAAKAARNAQGSKVAKTNLPGPETPASEGVAMKSTKGFERKAAAAKRTAETAAALKKGEIPAGET